MEASAVFPLKFIQSHLQTLKGDLITRECICCVMPLSLMLHNWIWLLRKLSEFWRITIEDFHPHIKRYCQLVIRRSPDNEVLGHHPWPLFTSKRQTLQWRTLVSENFCYSSQCIETASPLNRGNGTNHCSLNNNTIIIKSLSLSPLEMWNA